MIGNLRWYLSAHLGREIRQRVPGQQVSAEPETKHQEQQQYAAHPRQLARLSVRLKEQDAEQMGERHEDQKIRRPGVHRPDQPSELHLGHDELHALESFVGSRTVVHQQQGSGEDLHPEEEQRHAAEKIPVRVTV